MAKDDPENSYKPLIHAIESLGESANTIALLGLAGEFYSKEERCALYKEYDELVKLDSEAREAYHAAVPDDGMTMDQRVKMLGEKAAEKASEKSRDLHQKLSEAYKKLCQFEKTHPIIRALIKVRDGKTNK